MLHQETCTSMFTALFIMAPSYKLSYPLSVVIKYNIFTHWPSVQTKTWSSTDKFHKLHRSCVHDTALIHLCKFLNFLKSSCSSLTGIKSRYLILTVAETLIASGRTEGWWECRCPEGFSRCRQGYSFPGMMAVRLFNLGYITDLYWFDVN